MKKLIFIIVALTAVLTLFHCNPADGNGSSDNRLTLRSISPEAKVFQSPSFILTVNGTNFSPGAIILFNGIEKETAYVNSTELTCQIEPDDITIRLTEGLYHIRSSVYQNEIITVRVRNPQDEGVYSNTLNFTILSNFSFSTPIWISLTPEDSRYPHIAIDITGNINVVWQDSLPGFHDIYFTRSTDGGRNWSEYRNISDFPGDFRRPAVAIDGDGGIHVVFYDNTDNYRDLYFLRSGDGGVTWAQPKNISNNPGGNYDPAIAIDSSGNICVAWTDDTPGRRDIYFSRSTDSGVTWIPVKNITNSPVPSNSPDIAVDTSGNINLIWVNEINSNHVIYFSRSTDSGATWSPAGNISPPSHYCEYPAITVDSTANTGNIYAVWQGAAGNSLPDIFFRSSDDGGVTWSDEQNFSWGNDPDIVIDRAGNIIVTWIFEFADFEIYFSRSPDGGVTWTPRESIINSLSDFETPAIAVESNGNIHVVWGYYTVDNRIQTYYCRSTENGGNP